MIRKAQTEDIPALMAIQTAIADEGAMLLGYRADSAEDWAKRDIGWTLLAVMETETVGFIYCTPRAYSGECVFPSGARIIEIVDLIIAKPYRHQGLGHEMVAAIQRLAREDGFTHMRVYSAARRFDDIVKFYRSCGFTPWYLEMTREIGKEPAGASVAADRWLNNNED